MDRIWNSNITLFTVAEEIYLKKCEEIKQNFKNSLNELESVQEAKINDIISKNNETHATIDAKTISITNLERQIIALQMENEKLIKQNAQKDEEIEDIVS